MKTFCLGSGSSGNCFYIEDGDGKKGLIDIGFKFDKIEKELLKKNINLKDINFVILTHEHTDHYFCINQFSKKNNCPIFMTRGTKEGLEKQIKLNDNLNIKLIEPNKMFHLGKLKVLPLKTNHDCIEPIALVFFNEIKKVGFFLDLGKPTKNITSTLNNLDVVFLESNFCEDTLNKNKENLIKKFGLNYIQRLESKRAHISLQESLKLIKKYCNKNQKIILSHISQNTNTYENTYNKMEKLKEDFPNLTMSFQNEATNFF